MRNADLDFIRQKMSRLEHIGSRQLDKLHLELMIAKLDGMADAEDCLLQVKTEMHRRVDRMFDGREEASLAAAAG